MTSNTKLGVGGGIIAALTIAYYVTYVINNYEGTICFGRQILAYVNLATPCGSPPPTHPQPTQPPPSRDTTVVIKATDSGYDVTVTLPRGYQLEKTLKEFARNVAKDSIRVLHNGDIKRDIWNGLSDCMESGSYANFYRFADSIGRQSTYAWYLRYDNVRSDTLGDGRFRVRLLASPQSTAQEANAKVYRPSFILTAALERTVLKSGDPMVLSLTATKDCRVRVFRLYPTLDSVELLIPNSEMPDNTLLSNAAKQFPPPQGLYPLRVSIGGSSGPENQIIFTIAATNGDLPLFTEGASNRVVAATTAMAAINEWLSKHGPDDIVIAAVAYQVVNRE